MMTENQCWIGGAALFATALLLTNRIHSAMMFLLLLFGAAYGMLSDPTLLRALREGAGRPALTYVRLDRHILQRLRSRHGLPRPAARLPLTLGDAIISITEGSNRLFPTIAPSTEEQDFDIDWSQRFS